MFSSKLHMKNHWKCWLTLAIMDFHNKIQTFEWCKAFKGRWQKFALLWTSSISSTDENIKNMQGKILENRYANIREIELDISWIFVNIFGFETRSLLIVPVNLKFRPQHYRESISLDTLDNRFKDCSITNNKTGVYKNK